MDKVDFLRVFDILGSKINEPINIVLAGGSALLFVGATTRATRDGDVIDSSVKLSKIKSQIIEVAKEVGIEEDWLNDDVATWKHLLPPDWKEHLEAVGSFGKLTIKSLSRRDLILLKSAAGRGRDIKDLGIMEPSQAEIEFLASEIERIKRRDMAAALQIEDYVELLLGQRETAELKREKNTPAKKPWGT